MKTHPNDIAIVGMSCIFPGAKDLASYWENIVTQTSGIRVAPETRIPHFFFDADSAAIDRHRVNKGGFVDEFLAFDPIEFGMVPNALQGTEAEHLVALKLAKTALEDAGIFEKKLPLENAAIIIGKGNFGGLESSKLAEIVDGGENLSRLLRKLCPQLNEADITGIKQAYQAQIGTFNAQNIMGIVPNLTASLIANRFNCSGPAYTLDAACASSLLSIESGVRELLSGRCDLALAGAIHLIQRPAMFSFFQTLGALSAQQQVRPFDQAADGILTGEGCGFVVLKRLADAIADNHRIYAVIKGIGVSSDGSSASVMSPSSSGQLKAIERAWQMAGLDDRQIGYLEAHGTGTVLGDETELQTLKAAFPHVEGTPKAAIGAVKALIGHAMAAAGMAGFIKAAMALHKNTLPPTVNCTHPLPTMQDTHFAPFTEPTPWLNSGLPRRAGVNAFGFGGANAHAILEHFENLPLNMASQEENAVVLLARHSMEALASALLNHENDIGEGRYRIALFNPTEKRRELALRIIHKGVEWKDRQDIWFSAEPLLTADGSKLAFLFPGLDVPAINGMNDADMAQLANRMSITLPDNLHTRAQENSARKLEYFQLLINASLKKMGIAPGVVAGHSLGEWTAGRSISVLPQAVIDAIDENLSNNAIAPLDISFLSVSCSLETLEPYLRDQQDIYLSNDNCHQQVVVSALPERALAFQQTLSGVGIVSHILPFKTGYHTPFAEVYAAGARAALADLRNVTLPEIPIWSCITAKQYEASVSSIQQVVVDFITQPVRFRAMIEDMYTNGVRSFIQIGDGALTGFVSNILGKKPFSIIASGNSKRGTIAQLQRVVAALFVDGKTVDGKTIDLTSLNIVNSGIKKITRQRGLPTNINIDYAPVDAEKMIDQNILKKLQPVENNTHQKNADAHADIKHKILTAFEQNLAQINQTQEIFLNFLGNKTNAAPPVARQNIEKKINFSLDSFPYLIDHCPFRKRSITANFDNEQQPIVPFTLFIDLIAEFFLASFPGLLLARITNVNVHHFLWLEDNNDLLLKGEWQNNHTIRFFIDGVFDALVHTDTNALSAFAPVNIPSTTELQPPVLAREIYTQGYMFHGPLYQGIKEFIRFTDTTLETNIKGISVKGAMLDNMGQTLGLLNHFLGRSLRSFPVGVAQIDFYQSPIDQLGDFHCRAYTTDEDNGFYYSTIELMRDQKPWCRFSGWKTKKSDLDHAGWELISRIEGRQLSQRIGDGLCVLEAERYKQANTWLIMAEIYLSQKEKAIYQQLPVAAQRQYLLGRIAAKDAARDIILTNKGQLTHPASFSLEENSADELMLLLNNEKIHIGIICSRSGAIAFASDRYTPVLAVLSLVNDAAIAVQNLSDNEKNLIQHLDNSTEWAVRIHCAKAAYEKFISIHNIDPAAEKNSILLGNSDIQINEQVIRIITYKQSVIACAGEPH